MKAAETLPCTGDLCFQNASLKHECGSSKGDTSHFESAVKVNCKPLVDDLSNHNIAAGMLVYHDHKLRPKANRNSFPSGSVIFSAVHSAVNVFQPFINVIKTLTWSAVAHWMQNIMIALSA